MRPPLTFCKENFEILLDELESLRAKYNERGATMRDTGDIVRSMYMGSEVSKRILGLREENQRFRDALNKIASWEEGPRVSAKFDEPWSANIARDALIPKILDPDQSIPSSVSPGSSEDVGSEHASAQSPDASK